MKLNKFTKVALVLLCIAALVATSILGTLAYLTAQDKVVNTFTVGNVMIELQETAVNEYGVPNGVTGSGNNYKLIPGHTYVKDPTVIVLPTSEPCYVRMIVTINKISALKAACGVDAAADFLPQNFIEGWDPAIWVSTNVIDEDVANDTCTYEFRYSTTVDARTASKTLEPLFTSFTMPAAATNAQLQALNNGFEITVEAHAIQEDGFANADAAWAAFDAQYTPAP